MFSFFGTSSWNHQLMVNIKQNQTIGNLKIYIYLFTCGYIRSYFLGAGSFTVARGLSCPKACGILVPWPGVKPTCPALEGGLSTTGLPGKSQAMCNSNVGGKGCIFPKDISDGASGPDTLQLSGGGEVCEAPFPDFRGHSQGSVQTSRVSCSAFSAFLWELVPICCLQVTW